MSTSSQEHEPEIGAYRIPDFPLPEEAAAAAPILPELRAGRRRQIAARSLAITALAAGLVYLAWRLSSTFDGAELALSIPLVVVEVSSLIAFAGFAFLTWSVRPSSRPPLRATPSVDVYVATYNEPLDVLRPTLLGCLALDYPNASIWLLDDGRRPAVRELAERLGVNYLTRPDNEHAKAGNINAALPRTSGELVLVLDADHVPQPDLLRAVVGYFEQPDLAWVQTPHEFYNRDSVQHLRAGDHEQALFYRVIQPGKDHWGSAFWCGSAAVIRREALLGIGGIATETITEDFHTSLKLHAAGWRSRYHAEPLCYGIAPHNLDQYLLQRDRWARGNLRVFRTRENVFTLRGLALGQRLSYLASLSEIASGWRQVTLIAVLIATLVSGRLPLSASAWELLAFFLPWVLLSIVAVRVLARGQLRLSDASRYELFSLPAMLRAPFALLGSGRASFEVTPKRGIDRGRASWVHANPPLAVLFLGLLAAAAYRGGVEASLWEGPRLVAASAAPVLALAAGYELGRLGLAVRHLARRRQLRAVYRFPADLACTLKVGREGLYSGRITDLSARGMQIAFEAGQLDAASARSLAGRRLRVSADLGRLGHRTTLELRVTMVRSVGDRVLLAGSSRPVGERARRALDLACLVVAPGSARLDAEALEGPVAARAATVVSPAGERRHGGRVHSRRRAGRASDSLRARA